MEMIKQIPIKDLTLLERNPRKITKQAMDKLCESLKSDPEFLQKRPILVNAIDGRLEVYAGNQRVRAAKKLGWKEVPCIVDENLDAETLKSRVIKDNLSSGDWDYDILANEYEIGDLLEWGFEPEDFDVDIETIEGKEPEDDAPELPKEPQTKLGDLYELGEHRLLCGDSTNPDDVQKLLDGREPILMVTDPPYGVNYDPEWRKKFSNEEKRIGQKFGSGQNIGVVRNDNTADWGLTWSLFPGSVAYIWHSAKFSTEVQKTLTNKNFVIISQIIWAKHSLTMSRGDYHWQHEPCWYVVKKGKNHNWQGSRKETTLWEIDSLKPIGMKKQTDTSNEKTGHSTQKPIECMARPIRNNSAEGEEVYDPFLGSGTTLIAAEQLNRKCYGLEIDPGYCDIIVQRWVNYRKKNNLPATVKLNGEEVKCQPAEETK